MSALFVLAIEHYQKLVVFPPNTLRFLLSYSWSGLWGYVVVGVGGNGGFYGKAQELVCFLLGFQHGGAISSIVYL